MMKMKKLSVLSAALVVGSAFSMSANAMQMPAPVPVTTPIIMKATLTVPQEATATSPKTPATARGVGAFLFNPKTRQLSFTIDYAGLSSTPFMAHFHEGYATTDGPIAQTIFGMPDKPAKPIVTEKQEHNYGVLTGVWTVPKNEVKELLEGDIYINLHTKLNKAGEIRGQVMPS
ncbi:CHRD domain-containing protein [Vibrio sp. S4M6]|uniref:CHRD domain-containing protein n=1 Tax=Vibrio sinus TaxID=2946865 RepID=UPI002029DA2E|nr:CHRD domain-containing protein [Vibrio sinus]MCL9783622.1 CHRD domain-containing protein [Vibrio sinus]